MSAPPKEIWVLDASITPWSEQWSRRAYLYSVEQVDGHDNPMPNQAHYLLATAALLALIEAAEELDRRYRVWELAETAEEKERAVEMINLQRFMVAERASAYAKETRDDH